MELLVSCLDCKFTDSRRTSSKWDLGNFSLEFVDARKERAVKEVVSGVHLKASENSGVKLIGDGEWNTSVSGLQTSFDFLFFSSREFLSWNYRDWFFLVEDAVVIDELFSDSRERVKTVVLDKCFDEIIGHSVEISLSKSSDDLSLLISLQGNVTEEVSEDFWILWKSLKVAHVFCDLV